MRSSVGVRLGHRGGEHLQPAHVVGAEEEPLRLAGGLPGLELLHQLAQLPQLVHDGLRLLPQLAGLGLQGGGGLEEQLLVPVHDLQGAWPVVASMRRTPEATENSLSMWNTPTLAVLSRWVPPQNSTE